MSWLLKEGELDPARNKWFWGSKEPNLGEEYFTALGWWFKVICLYSNRKSTWGNRRLNQIYWSRDDILD